MNSPAIPPDSFLPNRAAVRAMAVVGLGAVGASSMVLAEPRYVFLATGLWALAITLLPVARNRDYPLFSTWSFVLLTVVIGVTLRGACLTFGFPGPERLDELYFLGREPEFFLAPAGWLMLGLSVLTLGWLAFPFSRRNAEPVAFDPGRLVALALLLLAVSGMATFLYIQRTGGFASGELSAKRTVIPDLDLAGSGYRSHGGLRFLASLAIFGHLLVLGPLFASSMTRANRMLLGALALTLLAVACTVPFYASLRTPVALNLAMSAAMIHSLARPGFRKVILVSLAILALVGIWWMTILRPSYPEDRNDSESRPSVARVFEAAVINRNQIELPKTAHLLSAVPQELPFQYGKTVARWALAPIPRSLWPDKPVIPPGPEIGRTVYDQRVAGVPPSLVAELYWNFHLPGVVIGAFALGVLLRWLQARFLPNLAREDFLRTALYVAGPLTLGFEAVGSSVGSGLFRAALQTVLMAGLILLVAVPPGRERIRGVSG